MRQLGAGLGGEQSGHILLRWGDALVGDGVVAGVVALQAARRRGLALSAARAEVVKCPQILRNVRVARKVPLGGGGLLGGGRRGGFAGRRRVVVRYGGTEPLLRIMVEGRTRRASRRRWTKLTAAAATIV
jgi:phosphoglucosamine mutase